MQSFLKRIMLVTAAFFWVSAITLQATAVLSVAAGNAADSSLLLMVPGLAASPHPVAQKTIGPGGGTLSCSGLAVTVPAQAFGADTAVSLAGARDTPAFVGAPQSLVWQLQIQATGWTKPLEISLGTVGGADRDLPVALADSLVVGADRSELRPAIVPGQVRSGVLYVELGATDFGDASYDVRTANAAQDVPTRREITFWKITGFETLRSDHFRLYYPAAIAADPQDIPQKILNFAEKAYAKLQAMGFMTTALQFPVTITVENGMGEVDGAAGVPLSGKGGQYLNLNQAICTAADLQRLEVTIGHEYFHIVQNLYNPRSALAIRHPLATPNFLMLSEASSVWFEARMLESETYVSQVFLNNMPEYAYGLDAGAGRGDIQNRGYWGAGFLRYLRNARGSDSFVYDLWRNVQDQGTGTSGLSDLGAVIETVGSMAETSSKWVDFLEKTASRNTGYANWPALASTVTHFTRNSSGEYVPAATFVGDIEPFAGHVWKVNFNVLNAGDNSWVAVAQEAPNVSYALYKVVSGSGFARLATLAPGKPHQFSVNQGEIVIAVATNSDNSSPYRATSTASVYFRLQSDTQYCLDVPHGWPMTQNGYERIWRNPTSGTIAAVERYVDDTFTQPTFVRCMDINTGYDILNSEWYANGQQSAEIHIENDLRHGLSRFWFENGQICVNSNYNHGYLYGAYAQYLEDGTLMLQGSYCQGLGKIGEWYYYGDGYPYTCTYSTCGGDPVCQNVN